MHKNLRMPVLPFHPPSLSSAVREDEQLVKLAQSGEPDAFAELVRRHGSSVYKLALRFVAHPEDAEDIAQETWLSVHLHLHSFRNECSFRTWLWHIVRNQSLGHIRRAKRSAVDLVQDGDAAVLVASLPSKSKSPEVLTAENEMHSLALDAIQRLKPKYRQPLYLWVFEDHDITEIAAVTGSTYPAAKIALFRARLAAQARVRKMGQRSLSRRHDQAFGRPVSSQPKRQRNAA